MRGVYGDKDPNPPPSVQPPKPGRSWWKIALIAAGVGAAGYFIVWPLVRKRRDETPVPPLAELPAGSPTSPPAVVQITISHPPAHPVPIQPPPLGDLQQEAHAKGFASVEDYEKSVLLHARQLRNAGTAISLSPRLAHLSTQLYDS